MLQKKIGEFFSVISVCSSLILFLVACGNDDDIERRFDADIIFTNDTSHAISYFETVNDQRQELLTVAPMSQEVIEIRTSGSQEGQTLTQAFKAALDNFQGDNSIFIEYDDGEQCLVYNRGEGSTTQNMAAYESRTIKQFYYEFTYTFTESEYDMAEDCQ